VEFFPSVQVELAGHVAEQIKFDPGPDAGLSRAMEVVAAELAESKRVMKAIKFPHLPPDPPPPPRPQPLLIAGVFHSLKMDNEWEGKTPDFDLMDKRSVETFQDIYLYMADSLRLHWPAVEALAHALLARKALSKAEAFQVIEQEISDESNAKAQAYIERLRQERMEEKERAQQAYEQRMGKKPHWPSLHPASIPC
jgi:hypothetical protein